jgi:hypothetical protein
VKTMQRTVTVRSRLGSVSVAMCVLFSLAAGALLTGCDEDNMAGLPFFTSGIQQAAEERDAARTVENIEAREAASGTVMQYEAGDAGPLAGDWLFTGMNYTPATKQSGKGKLWPDTELATVTFVKQGEVYSLARDTVDTVTFDGQNVTIEGTTADGFHSRYSGVLEGDVITGTRHHSVAKLVYDGPWTATRVE